MTGSGTLEDPFILTAHAVVSMSELTDVVDPSGPAVGEAPVWNGSVFTFAHPVAAAELAAADAPTDAEG